MRLNKGVQVILTGLAAGALCLLFVYGLYRLPPSRIYLGRAERYGDLWPPDEAPLAPALSASWRECHLHARNLLGEDGYRGLLVDIERRERGESVGAAPIGRTRDSGASLKQGLLFD